ncbi:MAG: DNA-processing protein DprA [Clostridia bacterium]|nr:DNA-processing protein DprA [Clostridia bacterium]
MENVLDWLVLSLALNGTAAGAALARRFGTAQEALRRPPDELLAEGLLTEAQADRLRNTDEGKAFAILSRCLQFGWHIVTPESPYYPKGLKQISDFPLVLYADGDLSLLQSSRTAAVVGSRDAGPVSLEAAYRLGAALSQNGAVTVSGGAVGVDSAAHEGALTGSGGTIAVLGTGFGANYLPEKTFMRRRIRQNGLLLTENDPFTETGRTVFPRRNRIIAGLAGCTVVVRAGAKSGSLITARHAERFGRALFALSPSVDPSEGCVSLLERGAGELKTTGDLMRFFDPDAPAGVPLENDGKNLPPLLRPHKLTLEQFAFVNGVSVGEARYVYAYVRDPSGKGIGQEQTLIPPEVRNEKKTPGKAARAFGKHEQPPAAPDPAPAPAPDAKQEVLASLEGDAAAVFAAIGESPVTLDELVGLSGIPVNRLLTSVTELELDGLVRLLPGNRVQAVLS